MVIKDLLIADFPQWNKGVNEDFLTKATTKYFTDLTKCAGAPFKIKCKYFTANKGSCIN